MGGVADVFFICCSCLVVIDGRKLLTDLIVLPLQQFVVILGMICLSKYRASINCFNKRVTLFPKDGYPIFYQALLNDD